ncbi:hypothetical protein EDD21DRAFT_289255, partial [Dissophora ornata]
TDHVVQALWEIKQDWLVWPDAMRRREIRQVMRIEIFLNSVGFSQKPAIEGEVYFVRKKGLILQYCKVVCDVDKRIIGMHIDCPGSWADSTVYKRMPQYKQPYRHFSPG